MPGLLAALWLLGLFLAAPALRTSARYGFADRLRDALILGAAIPFALGFVHLLYPAACWIALLGTVLFARAQRHRTITPNRGVSPDVTVPPYLLIAALALVAWPPLIRPLLEGDSVSYHLPNAASWVQAHGVWTAATRYWWYPPASEMFASALYAVAGPFSVGWSGFAALALLGFRIDAWARDRLATPLLADALAAATITAAPLALQGGTLQNDVWLAAFWLETLRTVGHDDRAAMRSIAMTALIKPYGWVFAAIAAAISRAPKSVWLAGAGALVLWIARDALMWPQGATHAGAAGLALSFGTSIIGNGLPALELLAIVGLRLSPFALLALLAALLGPAIEQRERQLGWAALAAVVCFLLMPFGYDNGVPQLAAGTSLRYCAPALALGALILVRPALRVPSVGTILLVVSTIFGAASVLALYWNDAPTRLALVVALLAVAITAVGRALRSPWPAAAGFAVCVLLATWLAGRHPVDFYTDALAVDGKVSGIYAWIAKTQPAAIGGWGLRTGIVNVLSPRTRTADLPDADPCAQARRGHILLIAVAEQDRTPSFNRQRLAAARTCGKILHDDGLAVVAAYAGMR